MAVPGNGPRGTRVGAWVLAVSLALLAIGAFAPPARAAPTLTILSPANGALVGNGTPVVVIFVVSDFNLTTPGGTGGLDPNEGHVDVLVDGMLTLHVSDPTIVLPLESGLHTIALRLVGNDDAPLVPDVTASVAVTVTRGPPVGTPAIEILYPQDGQTRGSDTAVSFRLANFALVLPGGSPAPNEGHIHLFLDGVLISELTDHEPAHFSDMEGGEHEVTLQLVDAAHEPLSPDVSATVHFTVAGARILDVSPQLTVLAAILAVAVLIVLLYPRRKAP